MVLNSLQASDLRHLLQEVTPELDQVDHWLEDQLKADRPWMAPLLDHAARFRGKRLRAAQVLLVGKAAGGLQEDHLVIAGIIELIHAATLVHDDLLDEAVQRRGLDCVHVEWGSHASVLLGDWIYARAFRRSTELKDPRCSQVLAAATERICAGEIHQNLTRRQFALDQQAYLDQIDGKTGALYEAGGRLAVAYAGGEEAQQEGAARHGLLAGRAFQMMDDLLDLIGEENRTRKSLGTDWARGKMTLPLIMLRDALAPEARGRLQALFGSGADRSVLLEGEFAEPLQAVLETCRQQIQSCLQQANQALEVLPPSRYRDALRELTAFLGARQY
ncbi:MAG: polyprenyl synthetase family protein [Planctomycetota bacterium]|nr:MAG: polyprenyl synthetase family protein [Planctomycetota bacterium]